MADPEATHQCKQATLPTRKTRTDRKSPNIMPLCPSEGVGRTSPNQAPSQGVPWNGRRDRRRRLRPRTTGERTQQQGHEVWPVLSCLPGAGQQVGSDRPGQEKQGERGTASQNAPSLSRLAPSIRQDFCLCVIASCCPEGQQGSEWCSHFTTFTQPV